MIDVEKAKSMRFAPLDFEVERGQLRAFAHAIGETNPIYTRLDAARAAGHPDLPVPPTFFFSMSLGADYPFDYLVGLGVDLPLVLHGEQRFTYHQLAHAGDTLVLTERIADVYAKRGGALEFVVKETDVRRAGALVASLRSVVIARDAVAG